MKTQEWKKVNQIVLDALELDGKQRRELIEDSCRDMPELRLEVESLLAGESGAEEFFGAPAISNYSAFFEQESEPDVLAGEKIGAYRIIREIGYGGMGAIYLAERADGKFEQQVALKFLKREMNTASLRRRFQQERAILASLQHPNIARLLDAGTTDDKVPYLVMEYVEGLPIDDYCAQNDLDLNERLDLFRKVCASVDFAHRNLVIHRDLKPSNILITADGVPKLLDFGISKILSAQFENADAATITRMGMMTPSYASPEQLKNESVTTATDVYSLGVILFELLSGHRPFYRQENDLKEIYKAVLEIDPPLPSAVAENYSRQLIQADKTPTVRFYGENAETNIESSETVVDRIRHTNPQILSLDSQNIRGDLDNIILKALRKEPERRYSSAENLSEDIKRHLKGLPVTAHPNTFKYRAEKFIKRNRAGVVAGFLVLIAIIGGMVATFWQSRVAAAERDRARIEAEKAKKTTAYLQNILNFSNPHWVSSNPKRNRDATIAQAIDEALKNIDTDLANEPEIQGEIYFTLGQTYIGQGQFDKADKVLRKAIDDFNLAAGGENTRSMQASVVLADTLYFTGKFDESEKLCIDAINYFRPRVADDPSLNKWLAIALNEMGNVNAMKGNFSQSQLLLEEGVSYAEKVTGKDRFLIPVVMGNLGYILNEQGDYEGSLKYNNLALGKVRELGNEQTLEGGNLYMYIAKTYAELRNYDEAEKNFQKSYEILQNAVGGENIYTIQNRYHLANAYYREEKYEQAKNILEDNLTKLRKAFPNHFTIAYSQSLLGLTYTKLNQPEKGEKEIREALDLIYKTHKEPNHEISLIKMRLGENLIAQKRFAEAGEVLTSALDGYLKTKGENHPYTQKCRELLSKIP